MTKKIFRRPNGQKLPLAAAIGIVKKNKKENSGEVTFEQVPIRDPGKIPEIKIMIRSDLEKIYPHK